ncbi:hypothetical protein [Lyngbya sp. PCC 8106]|uniref:hypothetical protein n=1 Tax=Lyngbya sp. (strain PCC 8106) TaxID=313612 RepID=UPI0000EA9768|nr:hypothetical protein [Lyngbya sp. PCC 8106]EAW34212.1 hypothetical protein L8106_08896 [Lyngbya sp. PCC 8106]
MKVYSPVSNFRKNFPKKTLVNLIIFYLPFLIILLVSSWQNQIPVKILTRDIFASGKIPVYTGFISNLGILTWCCSAVVCLFTFFVIQPTTGTANKFKNCLGGFGLISTWMMLDDFFMLHERVIPSRLGFPEKGVLILTLTWVIFHVIHYRNIIFKRTDFLLLGLAFLFFGSSLIIDQFLKIDDIGYGSNLYFILEDGSKLMGIATWSFYLCRLCYQQMVSFQNPNYPVNHLK